MDDISERLATPWWFWVISAVALVWNLMGVGAYIMQVNATPEQLIEAYGQTQADLMATQPAWYTGAFALAVFGGAIGCLLLLLRKKSAVWPLLLSLVCVIIQNIYFLTAGVFKHVHGGQWAMSLMIPIIAIFLVWFARKMAVKHIIN